MICSILLRQTPDEVRLVMIDPKMIELSGYEGIPHLIQKVVTDPDEALAVLNWGVGEMERRYELLLKHKARDIDTYNRKIKEILEKGEDPEDPPLPCIVNGGGRIRRPHHVRRTGHRATYCQIGPEGTRHRIHLILATQRPPPRSSRAS
jgi:S-DNA-T family DNA segregation ATPase FtsK/SpoIIIE